MIRRRVLPDFGEHPTIEMALTSFFLFACLFGNGQHKAARHKLREAVDLALSLGVHLPGSYEGLTAEQKEQWLRTYVILSVTERAYALQRRHPIDMRGQPGVSARFMQSFSDAAATDNISRMLFVDHVDATAMTGLMYLMEAFDAIDEHVVDCWIGYCRLSDGVCEAFDRRKALQMFRAQQRARQASISGNISYVPNVSPTSLANLLPSQIADITVTQFWLLNRIWSLSLSHGLLRPSSDRPELQYDFACHIANATLATCQDLSLSAMEVHGVGFVEKLHDIASGVVTVLHAQIQDLAIDSELWMPDSGVITCKAPATAPTTPRKVLEGFLTLMRNFRGGNHPYKDRLESAVQMWIVCAG